MAISEDTAALVAAQLTTAWAMRMGAGAGNAPGPDGPKLLQAYEMFRKSVMAGGPSGGLASLK
jgi:hypothetical protein